MVEASREETVALYELLADGEWHPGVVVMQELMRVIPPGIASRAAKVKDRESFTSEELIRMGRRSRAREAISKGLNTGRLVIDQPDGMLRAHWAGELPWQLRDAEAGQLSVEQFADELDIPPHTLRLWVNNDYVPFMKNHSGQVRFDREQQEIVRRVHAIWPGPGKIQWPVAPRSVWEKKETGVTVQCPNCDHKLTVTLGVAE